MPPRPVRTTPCIRFLFVAPCVCVGLPPDLASRQRPCPFASMRRPCQTRSVRLGGHLPLPSPGRHASIRTTVNHVLMVRACWSPSSGLQTSPRTILSSWTGTVQAEGRSHPGRNIGCRSGWYPFGWTHQPDDLLVQKPVFKTCIVPTVMPPGATAGRVRRFARAPTSLPPVCELRLRRLVSWRSARRAVRVARRTVATRSLVQMAPSHSWRP